jgi:Divergent AAA domain.
MTLPTTELDGHRDLGDRANAALDRLIEEPDIEFKESAAWDVLKWAIVKTVMAMGNLRDGGMILIGVSQRADPEHGMTEEDLATFDPDVLAAMLDKYIEPVPECELAVHPRADKKYLVLNVAGFDEAIFVCKKNGPEGNDQGLERGAVYLRPPGVPRTERVFSVRDMESMRSLLQVVAEKEAQRILRQGRRIGFLDDPTRSQREESAASYDAELGDL